MRKTLCGLCSEPSQFKMAAFYWRWTWPSGDARGYKQFFDANCVVTPFCRITNWDQDTDECNVCGDDVDGEPGITVYVTYYIPGKDREDGYIPYHEACFAENEAAFMLNAVRLSDRPQGSQAGGPPPATKGNPWDGWDRQGLRPV